MVAIDDTCCRDDTHYICKFITMESDMMTLWHEDDHASMNMKHDDDDA